MWMKGSRIVVLIVGTLVPVGLVACGSSGGGNSSAATSPPAENAASTTPQPDSAPAISSKLTPPGTKLAFGKPATVGWVPPSQFSSTAAHKAIRLQVTVDGIKKGTMADLKNVQIEGAPPNSTPYYVKVHVTNLGRTGPGSDNPALTLQAIDDRGQEQRSITFLGNFQPCNDALPPKPFGHDKSFDSCLTYLVPGGGSINEVRWNDGPSSADATSKYFDNPVVWNGQ
jgi:hypothetical protein